MPIIQQAPVDFITDPAPPTSWSSTAVQPTHDFWTYSPGMADYAVKTLKDLGLVGNGPDKTLGNIRTAGSSG